jgi:hypothetical protein
MDYFENFENRFSNKYEKKLKNKKSYRYILLFIDWWW